MSRPLRPPTPSRPAPAGSITWHDIALPQEEIEVEGGEKVFAQMPVIVSASRLTDIPAFYSDWFGERFNGGDGYVKCFSHDAELMKFVGARYVPGIRS